MSNASSEQSCVCEGVGYDEVYSLGQDDPNTSSDETVSSANSPSTKEDDDLYVDGSENDSKEDEDIGNDEPPIQSIKGPDGFRQFILLPLWMVNDFNSTIKKKHFETLREKYLLVGIPIYLPLKFEKCYYQNAEDVGAYKQMLEVGLRFPLSALHHHFLLYLGFAITQISLKAWRVFLGAKVLYGMLSNGACRMTVEEFFH